MIFIGYNNITPTKLKQHVDNSSLQRNTVCAHKNYKYVGWTWTKKSACKIWWMLTIEYFGNTFSGQLYFLFKISLANLGFVYNLSDCLTARLPCPFEHLFSDDTMFSTY